MKKFFVRSTYQTYGTVEAESPAAAAIELRRLAVNAEHRNAIELVDYSAVEVRDGDGHEVNYADLSGWTPDQLDKLPAGTIVTGEYLDPFVKEKSGPRQWLDSRGNRYTSSAVLRVSERVVRLGYITWINPLTGKDMFDVTVSQSSQEFQENRQLSELPHEARSNQERE